MKTVQLGKSGVHISAICLGTMLFGSQIDATMSFAILDAYKSLGGKFLDTANIYAGWIDGFHGGESETLIGEWIQSRKCRDEMFIATKVGGILHHGNEQLHDHQPRLTAKQIITECEQSLKRLHCDVIDLYYAHVDDHLTPLDETLQAFHNLIKDGKVRYIGASNITAWRLAKANLLGELHKLTQYVCVQQKYTYLHPAIGANFEPQIIVNNELLDYCNANTISLLAYSPLIGGIYGNQDTHRIASDFQTLHLESQLGAIRKIALDHEATPNQIVLAWMCQHENTIIPVIGVDTVVQLEENVQSLHVELSSAEVNHLDSARFNQI